MANVHPLQVLLHEIAVAETAEKSSRRLNMNVCWEKVGDRSELCLAGFAGARIGLDMETAGKAEWLGQALESVSVPAEHRARLIHVSYWCSEAWWAYVTGSRLEGLLIQVEQVTGIKPLPETVALLQAHPIVRRWRWTDHPDGSGFVLAPERA